MSRAPLGNPMRVVLLSILIFEVIVFGLAIPVMILVSDVPAGWRPRSAAAGRPCWPWSRPGLMRRPVGYLRRLGHPAGRHRCSAC